MVVILGGGGRRSLSILRTIKSAARKRGGESESNESFVSQYSHLWAQVATFLGQCQKGLNKHTATQKLSQEAEQAPATGDTGRLQAVLTLPRPALLRCHWHWHSSPTQVQGASHPTQSSWWETEASKLTGTLKRYLSAWLSPPTPNQGEIQQFWCDAVSQAITGQLSWNAPPHIIFQAGLSTYRFTHFKENNFALPSCKQLKEQLFFGYCVSLHSMRSGLTPL